VELKISRFFFFLQIFFFFKVEGEDMTTETNLIVNYIPPSLNEDQLRHLFMGYGNVESVKIVKDKMTQRSLGYGFVKFSSDAEANAAIEGLNGRQIENKILKVAISKPPTDEKLQNLYIAGLEPHLTKEDLSTIFQSYGRVLEAKILVDKSTGTARGIGFVKFETAEEAEAAIKALNGVTLAGTSKPLTVRVAEKKDNKTQVPATMPFGRNVRYNPMNYMQQPFQYAAAGELSYPSGGYAAHAFPGFQQVCIRNARLSPPFSSSILSLSLSLSLFLNG